MEKFLKKVWNVVDWILNNIPYGDKILHFFAGFVISIIILLLTGIQLYGFSGAFVLGLANEGYDNYKSGRAVGNYGDWFSTIAGGILAELIYM